MLSQYRNLVQYIPAKTAQLLVFTLLKTKGAVQEIGGAEFKLSTHQCLPHLFPLSTCLLPSSPTFCLTQVSPPPLLCSGWLSEGPHSPLNSYTGTLQWSNFELLPTMKYLPHRRDMFSQCRSRVWYKGATWKIERIWKEERSILKLKWNPFHRETAKEHDYSVIILLNDVIFWQKINNASFSQRGGGGSHTDET